MRANLTAAGVSGGELGGRPGRAEQSRVLEAPAKDRHGQPAVHHGLCVCYTGVRCVLRAARVACQIELLLGGARVSFVLWGRSA